MGGEFQSVITTANSIIGVSVLAMPFCFRQCGLILGTILVLLSGILVKVVCHLLVKSAIISRRRNYEFLAFETFAGPGKMAVEVSMIGFMVGTCIAFFVVIGDLAPPILATFFDIPISENLRVVTMLGICLFIVLPLTMLRNLESLLAFSTASLLFYCCVMLHIVFSARQNILDGSWTSDVIWWRPAGIFQCLPIICMALSCQCQIFEIYESIPDPSLQHMNEVVRSAVNICSGVYIAVGVFGNIACSGQHLGGNILKELGPSFAVEVIKFGFVLSVAVSFPLVVFPCRTAIHSLVFKKGGTHSEFVSNFIPPLRFNLITVVVVIATLIMGILLPDIEFVLGIVGSTIGNVICIILPAAIFVKLTSKNTTERLAAQAIFMIGLILMVVGTYVNLYEADSKQPSELLNNELQDGIPPVHELKGDDESRNLEILDEPPIVKQEVKEKPPDEKKIEPVDVKAEAGLNSDQRREPVEPVPPKEEIDSEDKEKKMKESENNLKKYKTVGIEEKDDESSGSLKEKEEKAAKLIKELEKQKDEHQKIIEEQKQVLQELKHHADEDRKNKSPTADPKNEKPLQPQVPVVQGQQEPLAYRQIPQQPVLQGQFDEVVQGQGNPVPGQQQYLQNNQPQGVVQQQQVQDQHQHQQFNQGPAQQQFLYNQQKSVPVQPPQQGQWQQGVVQQQVPISNQQFNQGQDQQQYVANQQVLGPGQQPQGPWQQQYEQNSNLPVHQDQRSGQINMASGQGQQPIMAGQPLQPNPQMNQQQYAQNNQVQQDVWQQPPQVQNQVNRGIADQAAQFQPVQADQNFPAQNVPFQNDQGLPGEQPNLNQPLQGQSGHGQLPQMNLGMDQVQQVNHPGETPQQVIQNQGQVLDENVDTGKSKKEMKRSVVDEEDTQDCWNCGKTYLPFHQMTKLH